MPFYAQHIKSARRHLQANDPVMKRILKTVGPFVAKTRRDRFATLSSSILSQQISVAAARTIKQRLLDAIEENGDPKITPESIMRFAVDDLRAVGISRQKAGYLIDLAEKVHAGEVVLETMHKLDDEGVIESLTKVKGIGPWTAQIFMMFSLGRLNVLPVDDLGIKNAIKKEYELEDLPDKTDIQRIAKNWGEYSTVACWYLWQSLEV